MLKFYEARLDEEDFDTASKFSATFTSARIRRT